MKKILLTAFALALVAACTFWVAQQDTTSVTATTKAPVKLKKAQRIEEAMKDNFERTKDLELGYPPVQRLQKALKQARAMQKEAANEKSDLANVRFQERGPKNIAGRTRTILIDKNDPSGKTVWAGAVSGGIWKSNDITAFDPEWIPVGDDLGNLTVGAMTQDPSNPQIMYMGSGELYAGGGSSFVGFGIYRSLDGGDTWDILPSTEGTGSPTSNPFSFTQDIIVHPSGDVYAATSNGLRRSQNQGDDWTLVLSGNMHEIIYTESNGRFIASSDGKVWRSTDGENWTDLSNNEGFPRNIARTEVTVCKADPNIIYVLGNRGGDGSNIYVSEDGGNTWKERGIPDSVEGIPNFTRGQGWYDLTIAVDPFNCDRLIVGGIDIFRSFDGGWTWSQFGHWYGGFGLQYIHADQHITVFDEDRQDVVYFGNDGGIWRSTNGGTTTPDRNLGFNVTQFYAGDIHPEAYRNFYIGGTQDNGSLRLNDNAAISNAVEVQGGDGFFAHIDQNEPNIQMVSLYFAAYGLSIDEGQSFGGGAALNGSFVSASDYDDESNMLYSQTNEGDLYRWEVLNNDNPTTLLDIQGADVSVSAVHADQNTSNRIYVGDFSGELYRIDNAHQGRLFEQVQIHDFNAVVSSIYVEPGQPDNIMVTLSNYGRSNNVFISNDGGQTWIGCEGNLPDMPVRWGIVRAGTAAIATELGVWFTDKLEGDATVWHPPTSDGGIPMVRTDMLQVRESDNVILAITYGRGMFTTDIFAEPKAVLAVDRITYVGADVLFDGNASFGAESYLWDFGDGTTSTERVPIHQYSEVGEYDISITINGDLTETGKIKVLPNRSVPYTEDEAGYSGNFDSNPEDYGVFTLNGTNFERGNSTIRGKDGTNSGDYAFSTGLNEEFYAHNTHTMLYLPNFDLSEPGIYEFSFWSKAFIKNGFHGYLVEYSLDKGRSWRILNNREEDNWYDFTNEELEGDAAFGINTSYFAFSKSNWTQAFTNITNLAGQENVAFRFVFRSNNTGNFPGIAIDDVEITRYNGELETNIVSANARYKNSEFAEITWTTQPEFYADEFIVERSFNGRDFEQLSNGKVDAVGKISGRVNNYSLETQGIRDLYFFRIRSISENTARDYYHEFTTPVMVISRNLEENEIYRLFPNPFSNQLNLTFTSALETPLELELFDASGKLVFKDQRTVSGVHTQVETRDLPNGVYFLRYTIGDTEAKVIRLMRQ